MKTALTARLIGNVTIAGLVGDRASWGERVDGEGLPALVMLKVAPGRAYTHAGADPLENPWVQIDCLGNSPAEVEALGDAVIAEVEPAATVGGTTFGQAFLTADRDMTQPEDVQGGERVFRRTLEFTLTVRE